MVSGSIRESMQVSTPSPRAASGRSPAREKSAAYAVLAAMMSVKGSVTILILSDGAPPALRCAAAWKGNRHRTDRSGARRQHDQQRSTGRRSPSGSRRPATRRRRGRRWRPSACGPACLADRRHGRPRRGTGRLVRVPGRVVLGHRAAHRRRLGCGRSRTSAGTGGTCWRAARAGAAPSCAASYHRWCWDLDGRLREVPSRRGFGALRNEDFPLFEVQVDVWDPARLREPRARGPSRSTSFLEGVPDDAPWLGLVGLPLHVRRRDGDAVQLEDADRRLQRDVPRAGSASRDAAR